MALGINLDGTHYVIPQVLSIVDVSELVDQPSFPTGRLAIIGEGTGLLEPGKPHKVQASSSNIEGVLQPSDLRTAALMSINPSPQLSGVPELYLIPVNPATQASKTLMAVGGAGALTLTTYGWGAKYNDVKVTFTTATGILKIQLDKVVEAFLVTAGSATKVADVVKAINDGSNLVSAVLVAEPLIGVTLAQISATAFTGGTEGTATNTDWQDAINQITSYDINLVCVLTSTTAVQVMLANHVNTTKRRGFCGFEFASLSWGVFGNREQNLDDIKEARSVISAAGEPRMVTPGIGATFGDVMYPSRILCAMYAGMAALVAPTVPLTNKTLNVGKLEVELDDSEVGDMIENGIAIPMRNHGPGHQGFVVGHQRTMWVADENLSRVEFSVGRGIDAIQRAVTEELWQFVGEEGVAEVAARAIFITNKLLARAATGIDFIRIVTFNPKATRGELIGTILRVFFEYTPILPINFVIAIAKLRRTTITATINESFDITLSGLGGSLDQQKQL